MEIYKDSFWDEMFYEYSAYIESEEISAIGHAALEPVYV